MNRLLSGILMAVMLTSLFSACGAAAPRAPSESYAASDAPATVFPQQESAEFSEDSNAQGGYMSPLPFITPSDDEGKKMVYAVDLLLQTTAFEDGTRNLLNVVAEMGGYINNAHIYGHSLYEPDVERSATYTFSIPCENLAAFLATVEDNYNLWRLAQESQDITVQHEQTDTRLTDLKAQEERLLSAAANAANEDEKLLLERELSETQAEISSLSASKGAMDRAVIYSTVTIQLYEVNLANITEAPVDSFNTKLRNTTDNSMLGFVSFWQSVLVFLIAVLPVIIVLAIFAAIVLLIMRFWRKNRRKIADTLTGRSENNRNPSEVDDSTEDDPDSVNKQ